jgi:hypothetical protein
MIKKINEERSDLFSQVNKYQEYMFAGSDKRLEELKVESTVISRLCFQKKRH